MITPFTKRLTLATAALAVAGLALAGCSAPAATPTASGSVASTKIGIIHTFGQPGISQAADVGFEGMQLGAKYVEEHGGLFNGSKIEFVKQPENGQPGMVSSSVRTLLNDNVKLLIGPALSADVVATTPLIDAAGGTMITDATSATLTGDKPAGKNFWRVGVNDTQSEAGLAALIAKKFPKVKTLDVVAYDSIQGRAALPVMQELLKKKGLTPTIGKEFFVPLTTTSYQSQISALSQASAGSSDRILVLLTWGGGYTNFIQQANPVKLFDNYAATMTTSVYYNSSITLKGAAPTIWNAYSVCHASLYTNAKMTWLTKEMKSTYNKLPDDWTADGFNEVLFMAAAINKAKSTDPLKVNKVLSTLSTDSTVGTIAMNATTHQASRAVAVCETKGDPSAPEGIKFLQGSVFNSKTLGSD